MPDTKPEVTFAECSKCGQTDKLRDGVCVRCLGARLSTWFSASYRIPLAAQFDVSTFSLGGNLGIQIEQGRVVFFIDDLEVIDRLRDALDDLRYRIETDRAEAEVKGGARG